VKTSQLVTTCVTMLMNGIMLKDLTNVLMTVVVMVKELVLMDGVLVMPDQMITDVLISQLMLLMLSMMKMLNVMLSLSILNVTTLDKSSKLSMKSLVLNGNQNPSVYQEEKPSESMIYVTSPVKKLCSPPLSLVSMILNSKC